MRQAVIQFDFTSYLTQLSSARNVNLGLNIDFTGSNTDLLYSLISVYTAAGVSFTEAMTSDEVVSAYNAKTSETFLGTKAISMSPTPTTPADYFFELDKTELVAAVTANPIITFIIKSVKSPGGLYRIATKENTTRTHPFIQIVANPSSTTDIESTESTQKSILRTGNDLNIGGLGNNTEIKIFNVVGQLLYTGKTSSGSIVVPIQSNWDRLLLVSVRDEKGNKTIKIHN